MCLIIRCAFWNVSCLQSNNPFMSNFTLLMRLNEKRWDKSERMCTCVCVYAIENRFYHRYINALQMTWISFKMRKCHNICINHLTFGKWAFAHSWIWNVAIVCVCFFSHHVCSFVIGFHLMCACIFVWINVLKIANVIFF